MGEEEYKHACDNFNRTVQASSMKIISNVRTQYEEKIHKLEDRIDQEAELRVNRKLSEYEEKSARMIEEYELKLKMKDKEIEASKAQNTVYIDEKIEEALKQKEENYKLKEMEFRLQISRIEKENEKMQKTLENVPPEFRGTAGETKLFDDLKTAFDQDDLVAKKVGVEMSDVIQTIVSQTGERIRTPIVWDMKTGESVTGKDIDKAKRYKEIYDTNYCFIVTEKGITTKDSKNFRTGLVGEREGVLLVNPKLALAVGKLTREFIIEKTKLIKSNNGRDSKQIRLYEYLTSSARFRKMQEKIEKKLKLDELQRKEEAYVKKTWNERKSLIQDWVDLDRNDQEMIDSLTEKEELDEHNEEEASTNDKKEEAL